MIHMALATQVTSLCLFLCAVRGVRMHDKPCRSVDEMDVHFTLNTTNLFGDLAQKQSQTASSAGKRVTPHKHQVHKAVCAS